jgi:hypothetical protein
MRSQPQHMRLLSIHSAHSAALRLPDHVTAIKMLCTLQAPLELELFGHVYKCLAGICEFISRFLAVFILYFVPFSFIFPLFIFYSAIFFSFFVVMGCKRQTVEINITGVLSFVFSALNKTFRSQYVIHMSPYSLQFFPPLQ